MKKIGEIFGWLFKLAVEDWLKSFGVAVFIYLLSLFWLFQSSVEHFVSEFFPEPGVNHLTLLLEVVVVLFVVILFACLWLWKNCVNKRPRESKVSLLQKKILVELAKDKHPDDIANALGKSKNSILCELELLKDNVLAERSRYSGNGSWQLTKYGRCYVNRLPGE